MKYRKKPVIIDAEQFYRDRLPWPEGVVETSGRLVWGPTEPDEKVFIIRTLEGPHAVSDGDFVITGVKGERYACKPDIFAMTYEVAE